MFNSPYVPDCWAHAWSAWLTGQACSVSSIGQGGTIAKHNTPPGKKRKYCIIGLDGVLCHIAYLAEVIAQLCS